MKILDGFDLGTKRTRPYITVRVKVVHYAKVSIRENGEAIVLYLLNDRNIHGSSISALCAKYTQKNG